MENMSLLSCISIEIHLVFFKKEYLNSDAALDHPDGLCVLPIFFEVSFLLLQVKCHK